MQRLPAYSLDLRRTRHEYRVRIEILRSRAERSISGLPPDEFDQADLDVARKAFAGASDLRQRLRVRNQQLYGEYDRLEAEASFRLNIAPPLLVLGITAGVGVWPGWGVFAALAFVLLAYQGLGKGARALTVIQRAVLSGEIEHSLESYGR